MKERAIRVLISDDSALSRHMLTQLIAALRVCRPTSVETISATSESAASTASAWSSRPWARNSFARAVPLAIDRAAMRAL